MRSFTLLLVTIAIVGDFVLSAPASYANQVQDLTLQAQQAYAAKNYELSEAKYRKALVLSISAPPRVQVVLYSNLGAACREARRFSQAEAAFRRAVALAKKSGIERDPISLVAMQHYAVLLRRMKKIPEAEAMEVEALGQSVQGDLVATPILTADCPNQVSKIQALSEPDDLPAHPGPKEISAEKVTIEQLHEHLRRNPDDYTAWRFLAYKHRQASDLAGVANDFENIVRRFPDREKDGRSGLAWCYYKLGKYQEAVEECKRLLVLDPDNADFYRILSSSYSNLGDMRAKLEIDEAYVEKFPGHADHSAVAAGLPFLRKDVTALSGNTQTVSGPTRNEEAKCWARHKMPIKVYIHEAEDDSIKFNSNQSGLTDNTPGEILQRAMDSWVQATEGRISFEKTGKQEDANICCFFTKDPDGLANDCAAGLTTWNLETAHPQAKISVLAVNRDDAKPVDRTEFYDTCLHEFGHALGLEHSRSTADIMYRSVRATPLGALSENDKRRIITLYKLGH